MEQVPTEEVPETIQISLNRGSTSTSAESSPLDTNSSKKTGNKKPTKRTFKENFKQQSFPAWQPLYTARTVAPSLFLFGLLFIPVGIFLWILSDRVQEVQIKYTDCLNTLSSPAEDYNRSCAEIIDSPETALVKDCKCRIKFNVPSDIEGKVYVYYALTNYYQNHRKYVSSRDEKQLRGDVGNATHYILPSTSCGGFFSSPQFDNESLTPEERRGPPFYFPCGAIANSMFSDEISIFHTPRGEEGQIPEPIPVPLKRTGISWESDRNYRFDNPEWFPKYATNEELQRVFLKPKHWRKNLWELDTENEGNNGLKNEDFIVWMRTAALPNFRKLFRILEPSQGADIFATGLPKGEYLLEVDYYYPVASFRGTKTIVITSTSSLGLPNAFLGMTYVIVGILCIMLGVFLLCVHLSARRKSHKETRVQAPLLEGLKLTYGAVEDK